MTAKNFSYKNTFICASFIIRYDEIIIYSSNQIDELVNFIKDSSEV